MRLPTWIAAAAVAALPIRAVHAQATAQANDAAVTYLPSDQDTDIAYILQGSATLVTSGVAVGVKETGPEEFRGTAIEGGETRELKVGDVVVIPNGTPHWFKSVQGPLLYYVVKVRQAARENASGAM